MSPIFFYNNSSRNGVIFLFFLYLTLIISFVLGENSTGGAIKDYINQKNISQKFSYEFFQTLYEYDSFGTRHSPVLIIFLSLFEKIKLPDVFIRLIHLHLSLLLPFFFYKCLTVKFKDIDEKILLFLLSLIFLSPTFRSLAIWPDSRLLGLFYIKYLFFKFEDNKNIKFAIYNVITLALSAYLSPNFSVFSIFLIKFFLYYRFFQKIFYTWLLLIFF